MSDSPAVILYDVSGNPMAVQDGAAIPANTKGLLLHGSDGTNARVLNIDSNGAVRVQSEGAPGSAVPSRAMLIGGSDGSNLRTLRADSSGTLVTMTLPEAVANGVITGNAGYINGQASFSRFKAIAAIRRNAYTEPSSSSQCKFSSSSTSDRATGPGLRKLRVVYYDDAGGTLNGPYTEDITMNGTTPVTMTGSARFIESLTAIELGSGNGPVGTITVTTNANVTICKWTGKEPQTQWGHHFVPSGKTCMVYTIAAYASGVNFLVFLRIVNPLVSTDSLKKVGPEFVATTNSTSYFHSFPIPVKVVGPARIELTCQPLASTNTQRIFATMSYIEI